jgi:hypothetical protein
VLAYATTIHKSQGSEYAPVVIPLSTQHYPMLHRTRGKRLVVLVGAADRIRDQLDAQMKALEAREKQAERKADTRRKVIAGALALEHFEKNPESEFGRQLFRLLDEYVVRPHDRVLFAFLPETEKLDGAEEEFVRAGREAAGSNVSPAP